MPKKTNLVTIPEQNKHYKGSAFIRWDALVANFFEDHPEYKAEVTANNKQKRTEEEKETMTDNNKWSEDEFDLQLYNSMDAEGKRAWRAIFGLPKLLKNDNPSANQNKNAEGDS